MSRGAACGPPFGMGWDVESSGAGDGFPPVLWFLLGLGVSDGPVGGEYSTCVQVWSRGWCHIWGGRRDGLASAGPHARPFECLRVSGPTRGGQPRGFAPTGRRGVVGGQGGSRTAPMGEGVPARRGGAPSGGMDSLNSQTKCNTWLRCCHGKELWTCHH